MKYRIIIFIIWYIFFLFLTTSGDYIHTKIKINGARRVRGRESLKKKKVDKTNSEAEFFTTTQDISIIQDRRKEEIESINQQIRDFVLKSMNAYVIEGISKPEVIKSESGRERTVKFDVVTDTGNITIYFKPVKSENEGRRTERASEAMLAPDSKYISVGRKGYTVMKHFEGIKLVDLLWNKPETLSNNYKWVFKNLGKKIAAMDKNEILYKDIIHFNTLINLDTHEIRIIDYEIALAEKPVEQIRKLINNLDEQIDISGEKQKEMLEIFNTAYKKALNE